ncbi:CPBP family intramembrane metalloprotease [Brevibacillus humidisoli]|uniref:CPBP family intramembrane glutamic endopeptidase n=1 Tax=Brevibacillus humidisoli TaxID=2895522 RepID=UPI001E5DBCB5|nr:CPBP family intramembrane glutamic endopeptidase [Brevibacillus humidisoli]UFJ42820.1 CPBP family intramembrane metalloprotease [Brevibacillus humidisoli]
MRQEWEMFDERTLRKHLYFTQVVVALIAMAGSIFLYEWPEFVAILQMPGWQSFLMAIVVAALVAAIGFLMDRWLPHHWTDDGEINKRIFQGLPLLPTAALCLSIGAAEEWLFRGVVQPLIGNVWTSLVFTVIHFRYFGKPVLLISVFVTSYVLGMLFDQTGSLIPPITAHALINFFSAILMQKEYRRKNR